MKHFSLILALLLGSSSLFAAVKCQEFFADTHLSTSDLGGWTLEQYNELIEVMKNWDTEFSDGAKIDQLMSRPGLNPEYRVDESKSLFQLAAEKDHNGFLTARLLRAGLDPFKRYSNGKNALIEVLELEQPGASVMQIMTGESRLTNIKFRIPRKVLPYDFYAFKPDGSPDKNILGHLENMKLVNEIIEAAVSTANLPLVSYIMETYKLRNFLKEDNSKAIVYVRGNPTILSEKKSLLKSAIKSGSAELIHYLLENQKLDPNAPFPGDNLINPGRELPLHYAISHRASARVEDLLLTYGANPYQKDERGKSPMYLALEVERDRHDSNYIKVLQKHGVKKPSLLKRLFFRI